MNINVKLNSGATLSLSETRMQHMLQGNESKALPNAPADTPLAEKMAFPIGLPDEPTAG